MNKEIDLKRLSVPIEWFVCSIIFIVTLATTTAIWVRGVNEGVSEIPEMKHDIKLVKKKLGIPDEEKNVASDHTAFFENAEAGGK